MATHAMDMAPITPDPFGEQVRHGEAERLAARVVVIGYDGSVASQSALRYAGARAGQGGHVVAVHACGEESSALGHSGRERHTKDYRSAGKSLMAALERELPPGVSFEAVLTEGPVPEALATAARTRHAEEIIVGARGAHPVNKGLGRVPQALLRDADRPVVIVPPGEPSR